MSDDLISRQEVIQAIRNERIWVDENTQNPQHHYHMMNEATRILSIIGNLPSVQPKTGQWVKYPDCGCLVYELCKFCNAIHEYEVVGFRYKYDMVFIECDKRELTNKDIGVTAFFNREQAEKALEDLKNGESQ